MYYLLMAMISACVEEPAHVEERVEHKDSRPEKVKQQDFPSTDEQDRE